MGNEHVCRLIRKASKDVGEDAALFEELAMSINTTLFPKEIEQMTPLLEGMADEMASNERRHGASLAQLSHFLRCKRRG